MTLVFGQPGSDGGARTHALIIGVGDYPYLHNWHDNPGIGHLRAASASARFLTSWLIKELSQPKAELGSVELLLSPGQTYVQPDGPFHQVETATRESIQRACTAWIERCSSHPNNTAIFYFCGYALEAETLALLPSDFGELKSAPFAPAIDFHATYEAMARCEASTQCYFLDICRPATPEPLSLPGFSAQPLLEAASEDRRPRTAPILCTQGRGIEAFEAGSNVSHFTSALVRALAGGAARMGSGSRWVVDTDHLGAGVNALLHHENKLLGKPQQQSITCSGEHAQPAVLHCLSAPPLVEVEIDCKPRKATGLARFEMNNKHNVYARDPSTGSWTTQVAAGKYDIGALFPQGEYKPRIYPSEPVLPPIFRLALEVR